MKREVISLMKFYGFTLAAAALANDEYYITAETRLNWLKFHQAQQNQTKH